MNHSLHFCTVRPPMCHQNFPTPHNTDTVHATHLIVPRGVPTCDLTLTVTQRPDGHPEQQRNHDLKQRMPPAAQTAVCQLYAVTPMILFPMSSYCYRYCYCSAGGFIPSSIFKINTRTSVKRFLYYYYEWVHCTQQSFLQLVVPYARSLDAEPPQDTGGDTIHTHLCISTRDGFIATDRPRRVPKPYTVRPPYPTDRNTSVKQLYTHASNSSRQHLSKTPEPRDQATPAFRASVRSGGTQMGLPNIFTANHAVLFAAQPP